jgi:cation diffusion facilitator family transporter
MMHQPAKVVDFEVGAQREKLTIALSSVAAAVFLTGMKLLVGLLTNSLGILSEAAHSALDLVAAVITYFAVRISHKPADPDHPYGHGKVENFSALIETVLLMVTCGWIVTEGVERLFFKSIAIEVNVWSFVVMSVSIVIDFSRSRALYRVARKYNSQALEADALHFRSDIWSSSVVIAGLIFAWLGFESGDAISALLVAVSVIIISLRLGKRTIDALMDKTPSGIGSSVVAVVMKVPGVESCDNVRIRESGPRLFIDMSVALKRTLPFERAHAVVHEAEERIKQMMPNADVVIHAEPKVMDTESLADKVGMIVVETGLTAHHVALHNVNGSYHLDLHLEYGSAEPLEHVHAVATEIEERIRKDIPEIAEVRTHIEDTKTAEAAIDVTESSGPLIDKIRAICIREPGVKKCEDIAVTDVKGRKRISMNCLMDRNLTVGEVHNIVSRLEGKVYSAMDDVSNVFIHAEPSG